MSSSLLRGVARHPILAFMAIALGAGFVVALMPPIVSSEILPLDLPLHGLVGGLLGVGLAAFVVTYALSGPAGVADLVRRSLRWRVPLRWYLIALLTVPVGATLISLAVYGGGAIGGTVWRLAAGACGGRYGFPALLAGPVPPDEAHRSGGPALALWHVPAHFAEEGWGVEQLIAAPVIFAIELVSLFFARALFVWCYNRTGNSVLLVAIFHASFDAAINQLSDDVVPGSNTARFLLFSGVIIGAAAAVIIAHQGAAGTPLRRRIGYARKECQ